MTKQTVLDWRELAPAQEIHECDCGHCDMGGDLEPIQWPVLVRAQVAGDAYVTDRHVAIRADLAPVPDGYEGPVLGPADLPSFPTELTTEPATGMHFRASTLQAVEMCGWRLRLLNHPADASDHTRRAVGVTTEDGTLIGWAIAAKKHDDDAWSGSFTREYEEADRG